jgi:hypothetical protein
MRYERRTFMRSKEYKTRQYALHLALIVRRRGSQLDLSERYGPPHGEKRKIGTYRSWRAVERAIDDYGLKELRRLEGRESVGKKKAI